MGRYSFRKTNGIYSNRKNCKRSLFMQKLSFSVCHKYVWDCTSSGSFIRSIRTMRLLRSRYVIFIGLVVGVLFLMHQLLIFNSSSNKTFEAETNLEIEPRACRQPELEKVNPLIRKHLKDVGVLSCNREIDWIETGKGVISINKDIVRKHGKVFCNLNYILRVDDFTTKLSDSVLLKSDDGPIPLKEDFFVIKCRATDNSEWKNIMAAIHRNVTLLNKIRTVSPPLESMKLNILIYGLDSMSRMHFMRKLPNTYKYLTEELKASVLKGYNIVGDGTPQALIPMLTGSTESELPETRKRMKGAQFVDIYPFAWKNFSSSGYVTAWGEEQPHVGTFTYRLKGFKDLPTDHCMRSFYLKVNTLLNNHPNLCLGNKPRHTIMLDWLKEFYDVYHDVPKFGFCFNSELSHDDYNIIGYADPDIEKFLRHLKESGILNNTLLIVMSDHGHRFAPIRSSQQGKLEERLPFFSFVLPPWMQVKYPEYVRNMKINENRLVTPFDVYATLMTVLHPNIPLKGNVTSRSISLFSEIPKERTCALAEIEPHWCTCLSWYELSPTDPATYRVGKSVIDFINDLTASQRNKCVELQVAQVTRLEMLIPNKGVLTFRKNSDYDGRFGEFSDNTKVTEVVYQVQVKAAPSDGIYEAVVKHNKIDDTFSIKEDALSRVNMYGNQEHCIHDEFPALRKYCYCKEQL